MRIAVSTALTFALAAQAVSVAAAGDPVPGTRVTLDPPDGFVAAEQFPGYQQPDSGASIVVNEIPARLSESAAASPRPGWPTKV